MAQYQHYIPQFLLRNFSHPYQPPKAHGAKKKEKKTRRRAEKGMYRGDKVVHLADLSLDEPQLSEVLVSRCFGQEEMYRDVFDTIKAKKDVEQELSRLESDSAVIIQKVKKAHENGDAGICLTRVERNKLRKFLFVMKYRGPGYFDKYSSEDLLAYTEEDKYLLMEYMAEKGFTRPRDVWLDNLRAILRVDMDAEGKWMESLRDSMFPEDAGMFIFHVGQSYIAFCTPVDKDEEFILTDNCYNLFEGPNQGTVCPDTGEQRDGPYLCFHEFGSVSPRLMIVLRSNILPQALEDGNSKVKESRQRMFNAAVAHFPEPEKIKSLLDDLPVAKAMNSYVRIVDGRLELAPGESGIPQPRDKFEFRFWPIARDHVNIINSIFLDNILHCKSVVFNSRDAFRRTLQVYVTTQAHGFKQMGVGERHAKTTRRACLEKLSIVLKKLGVENAPVFAVEAWKRSESVFRSFDDEWLDVFTKLMGGVEGAFAREEDPFWQTYRLLGIASDELHFCRQGTANEHL